MTGELVVLVPGAGVGGADLLALAWRLRRRGHRAKIFFCPTWALPLAQSARGLHRWLSQQPAPIIHLVGHSLGGLVILRCLAEYNWTRAGRVVTLGTPHADIAVARLGMHLPIGKWVAGRGVATALPLLPLHVPPGREVGAIAGSRSWGLSLFVTLPPPNDGVICVAETYHPEIAHHIVLPVSHTSMLFSGEVADETAAFLRSGQFNRSRPKETGSPL